ncbi:MAG: hypothetical protein HC824_07555 [Synechococcales cyanobacterium RM1_1_8]|nr:hypothetical protein [Synechococcales cyanobacterium RM1_1_8]
MNHDPEPGGKQEQGDRDRPSQRHQTCQARSHSRNKPWAMITSPISNVL